DLANELGVVAAALALRMHEIGHDVGGLAGTLAVHRADRADVARPLLASPHDFAEPTAGEHLGHGERENHRRRDSFFWGDAGMSGPAVDVHAPAIRADGSD